MDHLALEHEIANELSPFTAGVKVSAAPKMRREILEMLSQAAQIAQSGSELLNEAAYLAAGVGAFPQFATALSHGDKLTVAFGSASAESSEPESGHDILHDRHRSAFHFAMEAGHPIVIANLASETRFRDTSLQERGIKSGLIAAITHRDQRYGAIGLLSPTVRAFSKDDVLLLRSVCMYLGPALAHQRCEQSLIEHNHFVSAAIDSLDAVVLLLNADGAILQINRACQTLGGFGLNQLRGRRVWSAFWQPEEAGNAELAITELRNGATKVKREAFFVTKQGLVRRMSWTFANLHVEHSTGPAILATGLDITEHYQSLRSAEETCSATTLKHAEPPTEKPQPEKADSTAGRKHDRRPYQCIQMVAPCLDGKLPELADFREVRCYDISPGGFSFLLATKPNFDELVAAFGAESSRLYLRARVKHISPIQFEGHMVLLIGCEYLGRIRMPGT